MRPLTAGLLTVAAAALFAGWFFSAHDRVEREQYVGFRGEAYRNPYFAAELLVQELGHEADSRAALEPADWLPPVSDTIVMEVTRDFLSGGEFGLLWNWVAGGGHLVLLGPQYAVEDDEEPLAVLGLRFAASSGYQAWVDCEPDPEDGCTYPAHLNQIVVDNELGDLEVLRADGDIIAARTTWESGYITVIESAGLFANDRLETGSAATLFADLVVGDIEPGKVWLVFDTAFTPLWKLIWAAVPYLVIGLALLLLAWLWRALPAFGPRIVAETVERRSIIEHIHASGRFAWRYEGSDGLAESAVRALIRDAAAVHPRLAGMSPQQQAQAIARITGQAPRFVLEVISGEFENRPRDFTRHVRKLQAVRKEL